MQHCWTRAAWPQGRALFCAASSFMLTFEKKHFFFFLIITVQWVILLLPGDIWLCLETFFLATVERGKGAGGIQ